MLLISHTRARTRHISCHIAVTVPNTTINWRTNWPSHVEIHAAPLVTSYMSMLPLSLVVPASSKKNCRRRRLPRQILAQPWPYVCVRDAPALTWGLVRVRQILHHVVWLRHRTNYIPMVPRTPRQTGSHEDTEVKPAHSTTGPCMATGSLLVC